MRRGLRDCLSTTPIARLQTEKFIMFDHPDLFEEAPPENNNTIT